MFPSCNEYLGADGRQAREDWRASAASRILRQTCPQICQKKLCVFATGTTLCSFVLPIRNYTVAGRKLQCAVFPKVRSWDRHSYEKFPTISPQQSGSCPTRKRNPGLSAAGSDSFRQLLLSTAGNPDGSPKTQRRTDETKRDPPVKNKNGSRGE